MSSPSGLASNVMSPPPVGAQGDRTKKRGVGGGEGEVGVGGGEVGLGVNGRQSNFGTPESVQGDKRGTGGGSGGVRSGAKSGLYAGSQSQHELRTIKTPPTSGVITTPTRRGNMDNDDEVLAFDNEDLANANDSDDHINNNKNDDQHRTQQLSYVPTLLFTSPPSSRAPLDASLKLSASLTHPLMGTSRCATSNTPSQHTFSTQPLNTPSQYIHATYPLNTATLHTFSTLSKHSLITPY